MLGLRSSSNPSPVRDGRSTEGFFRPCQGWKQEETSLPSAKALGYFQDTLRNSGLSGLLQVSFSLQHPFIHHGTGVYFTGSEGKSHPPGDNRCPAAPKRLFAPRKRPLPANLRFSEGGEAFTRRRETFTDGAEAFTGRTGTFPRRRQPFTRRARTFSTRSQTFTGHKKTFTTRKETFTKRKKSFCVQLLRMAQPAGKQPLAKGDSHQCEKFSPSRVA